MTERLVSLKSGKQNGAELVLSVLRDALTASPTPQATKHALLAPDHLPSASGHLGPFAGAWGTRVPKTILG